MKLKFLLLTCITAIISINTYANNGTDPGEESTKKNDIIGGVYYSDTKKPIPHVSITAYSAARKEKVVLSNQRGQFYFDELKGGIYKFVFEKDGFKKVTKDRVAVRPDEALQLDVEMEEHVIFDFMPGPFNFSDFHK